MHMKYVMDPLPKKKKKIEICNGSCIHLLQACPLDVLKKEKGKLTQCTMWLQWTYYSHYVKCVGISKLQSSVMWPKVRDIIIW